MNKKGQSILEAVFAIGVLLIAMSAILALTISNIAGQKASEFQLIANNLAREGIEVVRNIRDSNWLAADDWDNLGENYASFARVDYNSSNLDFISTDYNLYINNGAYIHDPSSGEFSGFSRYLELQNICLNVSCPGINCGQEEIKDSCNLATEQKVGLKVTAVVKWFERGRERQIKIDDLLYDWK